MNSPLEILENRFDREPSIITKTFNPIAGALCGFGFAIFHNFAFRRPIWSGIQKHVGLSVLGGVLGVYFDKKRNEHLADRDAVLRHYIQLHPEDFKPAERKKYGDVLEIWQPIR